jgi:Tol biopolymer transport system component
MRESKEKQLKQNQSRACDRVHVVEVNWAMDLWQQVQEIFDAALQRPPEKRKEFLDQECGSNQELRREVESLLAAHDESGGFMAEPAVAGMAEALHRATSRFQPGDTVDVYKILDLVGRGGMGEVYRARDTRLKRDVAIKALPQAFSADGERLRRFEQEARSAAALNHPNIISIHEIGTADGSPYIVAELLEGQNLREVLRHGAVPEARGLAAAHDVGIIHRDLKPENIFITKDGRLKILDFGLAKLTRPEAAGADSTTAEVVPGTEAGRVFGTVGYMSPEQVRGQIADHRSDIFSFGTILYELFSRKRAFSGESSADTMSAILHQDPPELTRETPPVHPAVDHTIRHCLEKVLQELPLWTLPLPAGTPRRLDDIVGHEAAWSPDGQRVAYAQGTDLYSVEVGGVHPRKLMGGHGAISWVRWSPNGMMIRFTASERTNSSSIWEISDDGTSLHPLLPGWSNPPEECCGTWTQDGRYFVFQAFQNGRWDIWAIREKAWFLGKKIRVPSRLTAGPLNYTSPLPSVEGKKLFAIGEQPRGELVRYDNKVGQFVPYLSGISAYGVSFSTDGKWVAYVTCPEGKLWRSRTDGTERLQLTFSPMYAYQPYWSQDGEKIAFMGAAVGKSWQVYVVPAAGGNPALVSPEDRNHADPSWSPDELSLAFGGAPWAETDHTGGIFILDLKTNQVSKIANSERLFSPHWSPDGRYIAVQRPDNLKQLLFDFKAKRWDELTSGASVGFPNWSHDGKYIYYDAQNGNEAGFYRVRISDHKVERITIFKDVRRAASCPPGYWAGLAPDDSPLLVRDVSTQEIYALDLQFP